MTLLKRQLAEAQNQLSARTVELNEVRNQMRALEAKQTRFEAEAAPTKIAALEAELVEMKDFRRTVDDFMRRTGPR
jgi:chromosome segregation ATPase